MKYLLLALAIFLPLAQLVSGNWYVKKCANKSGNCRSKCRTGEVPIVPPTGMCSKEKTCCVLNGRELNPILCHGVGSTSSSGGSKTTASSSDGSKTTGSSGGGMSSSGSSTTGASQTGSTTPGAGTAPASTTAKVGTTATA